FLTIITGAEVFGAIVSSGPLKGNFEYPKPQYV
ncbi:hypothetical protein RJ641_016166, partial [Dillenia turbinata]